MSIQPGIGYDIISTPEGDSLIINIPDPIGQPKQIEQFEVQIRPDPEGDPGVSLLKVARGVIIIRSAENTFTDCLRHYRTESFAVTPTNTLTVGSTNGSDWMAKDGYISIKNLANGGSDEYGIFIIVNHYRVGGGSLEAGVPYMAVMIPNSDAESKTRNFIEGCDRQIYYNLFVYKPVSVVVPYEPYEVSGNFEISQDIKLYNYNCQRLRIANIYWNDTDKKWDIVHFGYGPITIPRNNNLAGTYKQPDGEAYPDWVNSPNYGTQQEDWEGTYIGSEKWNGLGYTPTSVIAE